MKVRKILLWITGIAAGYLLSGCGPSAEEMAAREQVKQDSIAQATLDAVTKPIATTTNADNTPAHTYNASDFNLPVGIVVRWMPRTIPDDVDGDSNFPEVYIHIKQADGIVRISRANWNIWQNLVTGDTLK